LKYSCGSFTSFDVPELELMLDLFSGSVMMPATRSIRGQIVVALYTYQGSEFGDMTFKKGDMMEIVDDR
jgi:hypothetical protein